VDTNPKRERGIAALSKRSRETFLRQSGNIGGFRGLYSIELRPAEWVRWQKLVLLQRLKRKTMKKLLMLVAAAGLGLGTIGCAENKAPPAKPAESTPAPGPSGEAKPDGGAAPAEPAPTEKKD